MSDAELIVIAQAKQGDAQAFAGLYEMHKMAIFHTVLAITNDRAVAEEILQETFIKAFQNLDRIYDNMSLAPWLYRVAVNMAYNLTTRRKRGLTMLNRFVERWLTTPPLSLEQSIEARELQTVLYEAINTLEFKQRATLVLHYLQGFSVTEISEIMDCPVGTVKSRLYHARENLRRKLVADKRWSGGWMYEFAKRISA